jgi:hypothetical protein
MHRLRGQQRQQHVGRTPSQVLSMEKPTKSRKVSKIRTVSTIHRTTRLEPPTEDTTNDAAPQPNVSDTADAIEEEQASSEPTSEPPIPVETVQPPVPARKKARMVWPRKSGLPGFGSYRGTKWYDFETEEQDEHDDPPLPATTSNTRRSIPVTKYEDRHSEPEPTSGSKLPGHVRDDKPPGGDREYHGIGETEFDRRKRYREIKTFLSELPELPIHSEPGSNSKLPGTSKDDKSPGGDREQPGTGKMSQDPESPELPESEYHFNFRPDTSPRIRQCRTLGTLRCVRSVSVRGLRDWTPKTIWAYTFDTESLVAG